MLLRATTLADLPQIHEIYAHEVLHGNSSFELQPPTLEQMIKRHHERDNNNYPCLTVEIEEQVAGYAYGGIYRTRPAYRNTIEDSVYTARWARRRGVATLLLRGLIEEATKRGFHTMLGIITAPGNRASITLHENAGFEYAGTLKQVGYKHDQWLDTIIMQRLLY